MKRELDGSDAAKSVRTGAPGISSPNGWLIGIGVSIFDICTRAKARQSY